MISETEAVDRASKEISRLLMTLQSYGADNAALVDKARQSLIAAVMEWGGDEDFEQQVKKKVEANGWTV